MSFDAYPARFSIPEVVIHPTRVVGTGASAPTKEVGEGITVTRTSEGLYKYTWTENPGTFLGMTYAFGAATPADIEGHSLVRDTYDTSAYSIEVLVSDASEAVDDIEAVEYLDIFFHFRNTTV